MRFKSPKRFFAEFGTILATLFVSSSAHALTVTASAPYVTLSSAGGEYAVYYPDSTVASPFYVAPDFQSYLLDFSAGTTALTYSITNADTSKFLWILVTNTGGTSLAINLNSCNSGPCTGTQHTSLGSGSVTVQLLVSGICANGTNVSGCTAGNVFDLATLPVHGVRLNFVESAATTSGGIKAAEITAGVKLTVYPQFSGPDLTACPGSPGFFPADQAIIVDTNSIQATADTVNGSSATFQRIWVKAKAGGLTPGNYSTATISQSVDPSSGDREVAGFENSTPDAVVNYGLDYGIQDSAGVILFCGDDGTRTGTTFPLTNAFATDIQGFLRESNCFVATASFRSGHAPMVMMLREFRDEILSRSELGRGFIAWYYTNGPIAADWLIAHPVFRTVALAALIPLQAIAWISLHPSILWIPLFSLIALLALLALPRMRRRSVSILMIIVASTLALGSSSNARAESSQPYIDSLISELPSDAYSNRAPGQPDPYIRHLKQGITSEESTGYTEELKKSAGADPSKGYTDRIQKGLPRETGSAIEDYRKGKKLKANKGDLTTSSAFGFQIAATANRTYTAGANQDVAYDEVYGSGWIPDFKLHFEARPFPKTSFLSNFGLYGSAGFNFAKANGIFNYNPDPSQFGSRSRTEFKFIMIPVNTGLIYRMNWGILWPYFGAGPSAIGFVEQRGDQQKSQRGYSFGYWYMGGIALGLDWLSSESSWSQYETAMIKHSYLAIEYSYLSSISGGLVDMTVDGVQVGFTFEL